MKKKLDLQISVLALLLTFTTESMSQNIVTVTDCNLQGWVKQTQVGTTLLLKNGIAVPPLGKGSIEFSSPNVNFVRFRSTSYHNTLLSTLTEFSYSTYVQNRENNKDVNYVVLLIDKNNDGRTDDNIVFDPRFQSQPYIGNNFPDQGLSIVGAWQTWNMLTGAWWLGPPPRPDPDHGGTLFTLSSYIAQNPNAKIINDAALGGGGIRLTGGAVPPIFAPNFLANADNFRIGINGVTTVYDFEFTTANAGADKNVIYGYDSNCTTLSGSAAGGVAPYTYSWSVGAFPNNTATTEVCPVITTNYTLTVTDANGCSRMDDVTVFVNDVRCGSKMNKVKICHNGEQICVATASVQAHLNHGDILGSCISASESFSINEPETSLPEKIRLSNYPNPFTGITRLEYELPVDGEISIKIYDGNGKEIKTLINNFEKAGIYFIEFDATNLKSGIYFSRLFLKNKNSVLTQYVKLVLVK